MDQSELKRYAEQGVAWIKQNPAQAALIGAGAGFALGFLGFARLALGVRALAAVPGVADLARDLAARSFAGGAEPAADDGALN